MNLQAFFFPASFSPVQLTSLLYGQTAPAKNLVDFPDEEGGTADQNLAVPWLAGMDGIEVEEARLTLRTVPKDLDIETFSVTANGKKGVFLSLPQPVRLKKVAISYTLPAGTDVAKVRLVVRAASPAGSSFTAGVPLFVFNDFGPPDGSSMYGPTLGGMSVSELEGGGQLLTLPSVLGNAWLIQLATGGKPTELQELEVTPTVSRVTVDAAPRNLAVALLSDGKEVPLWNNPETLFPDAGEQEVSFTPLAQRHLTAALKDSTSAGAALSVPLRFSSKSGGAIDVTTTTLKARYVVRPLGDNPVTLRLGGDFTRLALQAPAGLAPERSLLAITAKLLGRELNGGSPEPPSEPPTAGVRVGLDRVVTTPVAIEPLAGEAAGAMVEIAGARLYLSTPGPAEVVLEMRADVAGAPGPAAARPMVRQMGEAFCGWLDFEPARPLAVVSGGAPLWLSLRANKGDVFWFVSAGTTAKTRISLDRGETWGELDPLLAPTGALLAQLFHTLKDEDLTAPVIRLQRGSAIVDGNLFPGLVSKSKREYVLSQGALDAVHTFLAARTGEGKLETVFSLFSRSVLDLTVHSLVIKYDPLQGVGR